MNFTSLISMIGIALGVACLFVAMAAVSGYETTLKRTITDLSGHVHVMAGKSRIENLPQFEKELKDIAPEILAMTPFAMHEAAVAGPEGVMLVILHGLEPKTMNQVTHLDGRLIQGKIDFKAKEGFPQALVGMALAQHFGFKVGSVIPVILPNPVREDASGFSPKLKKFRVAGILDLGKHDLNQRTVIADLSTVQKFAEMSGKVTGINLLVKDSNRASETAFRITTRMGANIWAKDWREMNRNLFSALEVEKIVIFFVILIMVIAAAFNVSTTLFITVMKRYGDMGLLKALGARQRDILFIFILHGLLVASVGSLVGLLLGGLLSLGFMVAQNIFHILPADVYKLETILIDVRLADVLMILVATYLICFLSTLIPALRGARFQPVEGLRYE